MGQREAKTVLLSKLSANPYVNLARVLAVKGAMSSKSASSPKAIWRGREWVACQKS